MTHMEKEKILITGGAGYIGSVLTNLLLNEGYKVTVVDNLMYGQNSLIHCFCYSNFKFIKGDVCNHEQMRPLIHDADIIIPLAAIVGAPACDRNPILVKMINYDAIEFILSETNASQKIIFPTTNSGYGIGQKDKFCDENTPLNPISLYGRLKVQIEEQILKSQRAISLRLATVFGPSPRMRLDLLVNDFVYKASHDRYLVLFEEHFKRNYIHIRDVAETFLFAIKNYDKMVGQAFNVGLSSANLNKKELCECIAKHLPHFYFHSAPVGEDPDKRDYIVSNDKLESLGWLAKVNIDEGIKELVHLYKFLKENQFRNI